MAIAMYPRLSPRSRPETLKFSPVSGNNPFGTSRHEHDDAEGLQLQKLQMKLAVLEHQQTSLDTKVMQLEGCVKSLSITRPGPTPVRDNVTSQLWELKQEIQAAVKDDELHRAELRKQVAEGQTKLRRELFDTIMALQPDKMSEQDTTFRSDFLAASQTEVTQLGKELREEMNHQGLQVAEGEQELRRLVLKMQEELSEVRGQIDAPAEFEKVFEETVVALAAEMKQRTTELEQALEAKISEERQALEGKISLESQALDSKLNEHMEESHGCLGELKDRSLRLEEALDSRLLALKQELSESMSDELKSIRQEQDVNNESLRLELQTCLAHKICDEAARPMEQMRFAIQHFEERLQRCNGQAGEQEERQVATRVELERLRQDVSTHSAKLLHFSEQNWLSEDKVRSIVSDGMAKVKSNFQEWLQPFSPIERRLEQLAGEVSRHQSLAERAREELGGLLRAEMHAVAMDAASRQRKLLDDELRSLLDVQRRQFSDALEGAANRASGQLKDLSTSHASEVRALANRLSDAERFAQQVGFAVREMQKQKVKALQNGQVKSAAPVDELLLQQLQQEMHGFARFNESKIQQLQEAFLQLKATSSEHAAQLAQLLKPSDELPEQLRGALLELKATSRAHAAQLESLASEALATQQRLDTALLLEATKVKEEEGSPQWTAAVKGMESLSEIVGSLEREAPGSTVAAVRHELQMELKEVWRKLNDVEQSCPHGQQLQAPKEAPKARPKVKSRSHESESSSESYTGSEQ